MGVIYNIHKEMKSEKIRKHYEEKNRLIDAGVYNALKARKKCMRCKKKFSGRIPEIHHKIPISRGGENTPDNLLSLCKKCHEIMDKEAEV